MSPAAACAAGGFSSAFFGSSFGGSFFPAAAAALSCDRFDAAPALADALAAASCCPAAWPALCFAPAPSPRFALRTASCAVSTVSAAFFAAFSASPIASSAAWRTFSSSGTLQAPVAVALASLELFVALSAAAVALSAALAAPSIESPVPGREGSARNSCWFLRTCSFALASAASARWIASLALAVSFSASISICFSCSFTVSRAFPAALFPWSAAPCSFSIASPTCWRSSGIRSVRPLSLPCSALACSRDFSTSP